MIPMTQFYYDIIEIVKHCNSKHNVITHLISTHYVDGAGVTAKRHLCAVCRTTR